MNEMIPKFLTGLVIILFSCTSIYRNNENITGYNFSNPSLIYELPDTLREVSGLTLIDSSTFACIQDENGILFIYDIVNNSIRNQYPFHIDGDYEGITKVDSVLFILRSDGTLFEINLFQLASPQLKSYVTGIPANNNEGLCYDRVNNRLLIACKGNIGKGEAFKDRRAIYGFDLRTKTLSDQPVFDFDIEVVKDFAVKNKIDLPSKVKKKKGEKRTEPFIKFRTSAIGIHPKTKDLFLLSASDFLLFIFDHKGGIKHMEQLNPVKFNKAEGITFYENGDMLITNEAQDKKPTVLKFNYKFR